MIVVVHAAATLFMTGLIWFVQIVHYPLFAMVDRTGFAAYEAAHQRRTTWVVAPVMLTEAVTSIIVLVEAMRTPAAAAAIGGAVLLLLIWLLTATEMVPLHRRLAAGFDAARHRRLVVANWVRTVAWTARGIIALWLVRA